MTGPISLSMSKHLNNSSASPRPGRNRNKKSINKNGGSGAKFEFITSLGPPEKARNNEESSRLVRIHAMQSFLRQRASESTEDNVDQSKGLPILPKFKVLEDKRAGTGKFKLASWSRKSRKVKVLTSKREKVLDGRDNMSVTGISTEAMIRDIVRQDLGPYNVMTVSLSPATRRLLHYCRSNPD
jgi:hypothetical protein